MFDFNKFYEGLSKRTDFSDYYLARYPRRGEMIFKDRILELLKLNYDNKDSEKLVHTVTVAYLDGVDEDYTDIFLLLLEQQWHYRHEDIVTLLEFIQDPKAVDQLYKTCIDIPEDDDLRSLARKCISALGATGSEKAIKLLRILTNNSDQVIKSCAEKQLSYFN